MQIALKSGDSTSYDGACRYLTDKQIDEKLKSNTPYIVRLRVPKEGETILHDNVYGKVKFENKHIDDQVSLQCAVL